MRKTININLFGTLYTIDEDACKLLEEYLDSIKQYFSRQEGGEEIADDIEHRVAELLWEKKEQGVESIDLMTVKTILKQIGKPEEMSEESKGDGEEATANASDKNDTTADDKATDGENAATDGTTKRKLYRNPKDKILGGVISGLTNYFGGNDPLIWRILFLAVTILLPGFIMIIIYLVLWLLIPEAKTAEDRLRMKGKTVNPVSIQEEIVNDQEKSASANASDSSNGCAKGCFITAALIATIIICGMFFVTSICTSVYDMFQGHQLIIDPRNGILPHEPFLGLITGIFHNLRIFVAIVIGAILVALYFLLFHTSKKGSKIVLLVLVGILALLAVGSIKYHFPPISWCNYTYTRTSQISNPDGSTCEVRYTKTVNRNDTIIRADTIVMSEPLPPDDFAE